ADRVETKSGTVKGKISYLSPEQCRGSRVDRRSDLFSLGIVMWEMLTGARLYRRSSDFENMTAIVHEPPPPPSSRRPDVPRPIDPVEAELAAVPDLSVSMVLDDDFGDGDPDEAATDPPRPAAPRRDAALALGSIAPPVDEAAPPRRAQSSPPFSPSPPAGPPA